MNNKFDIEKIFHQQCIFIAGAASKASIPITSLPEYAFVGRSNVGKSSLLNAIVYRKTLAKISQNPGRTCQINFFRLAESLMLVDLPGYGYAKVSKSEKNNWNRIIYDYLNSSKSLRRVFLLVDARHNIKTSDLDAMDFLDECAIPYQVVLTKKDKVNLTTLEENINLVKSFAKKHSACHPDILICSSKTGDGIESLRNSILLSLKQ